MDISKRQIVSDLFQPKGKQYEIPIYQRNYSWTSEQCKTLFEDIETVGGKDDYKSEHYIGSVYFKQIEEKLPYDHYYIIDGQQRLTTLFILFKALSDVAERKGYTDLAGDMRVFLFNERDKESSKVLEDFKLKLKSLGKDNLALSQLLGRLHKEHDLSVNGSKVFLNYRWFVRKMEGYSEDNLRKVVRGLYRLSFASVVLESNDGDPQEVFDRINSTGLELTLYDKVRNYMLMDFTPSEQTDIFYTYFSEIEGYFNEKELKGFIDCFIKYKNNSKENPDYKKFKLLCATREAKKSILDELLFCARHYDALVHPQERLLISLRKLDQESAFPFLLHIFEDARSSIINEDEKNHIVQLVVSRTVYRGVCGIPTKSENAFYAGLYKNAFSSKKSNITGEEYIKQVVNWFLRTPSYAHRWPSLEEFRNKLEQEELYIPDAGNVLCRFLLLAIENSGKEKICESGLTIEHIMPQTLSDWWVEHLGGAENASKCYDKWCHNLGNLSLTAFNSEMSNASFPDKQQFLRDSATKAHLLNKDVLGASEWKEDQITSRADRLANIIVSLFSRPESCVDAPDTVLSEGGFTCNDSEYAENTNLKGYILNGVRNDAKNYSDLLSRVLTELYARFSDIFESMASRRLTLTERAESVLFSFDESELRTAKQLLNSALYYETNFNAPYIIRVIDLVLTECGYNSEDVFRFFATPKESGKRGTSE